MKFEQQQCLSQYLTVLLFTRLYNCVFTT